MKTVAIIHGWAGGNWLFKRFRSELEKADFEIINNPAEADIVIAHSAGCYRIPSNTKARLIIMVGLPFGPNKSLISRMRRHRKTLWPRMHAKLGTFGFIAYVVKAVVSVITHPRLMLAALRNHGDLSVLRKHHASRIILVRNHDDILNSPELFDAVKAFRNVKFVELPGFHDDIHDNPHPYVNLILKEYN